MFDQATVEMLMEGVVDTLYMTIVSTFFSYVFGIVMAVVLVICRKDGIRPNPVVYSVLDVVVNLTRSFPFLILMIAVIPFTRYIVGTTIGNNAFGYANWSNKVDGFTIHGYAGTAAETYATENGFTFVPIAEQP